jgi:hypothetical protein
MKQQHVVSWLAADPGQQKQLLCMAFAGDSWTCIDYVALFCDTSVPTVVFRDAVCPCDECRNTRASRFWYNVEVLRVITIIVRPVANSGLKLSWCYFRGAFTKWWWLRCGWPALSPDPTFQGSYHYTSSCSALTLLHPPPLHPSTPAFNCNHPHFCCISPLPHLQRPVCLQLPTSLRLHPSRQLRRPPWRRLLTCP